MGRVREISPAVLVAGITWADDDALSSALRDLVRTFGPVEIESPDFAFDMTDYYTEEMGGGLRKRFICFRRPIPMDDLPGIKLATNAVETTYTQSPDGSGSRRVNIDPGYVTLSKLVLATTKDYSHRVYIGRGIFAETTLRFVGGSFVPFDTTYPDYRTPLALDFFNLVRDYVKRNAHGWTREHDSKTRENALKS